VVRPGCVVAGGDGEYAPRNTEPAFEIRASSASSSSAAIERCSAAYSSVNNTASGIDLA